MVPGLPDHDSEGAVCEAASRLFNLRIGILGKSFSVAELEAVGAERISLAISLYRAAIGAMVVAA